MSQKIAMVSYADFKFDRRNGWENKGDNVIFLFQAGISQLCKDDERAGKGYNDVIRDELIKNFQSFDKLVFYIGEYDNAKRIIKFVYEQKIESSSVVFVMCPCGKDKKIELINSLGLSGSNIVECGCGGYYAMLTIYHQFLNEGTLP